MTTFTHTSFLSIPVWSFCNENGVEISAEPIQEAQPDDVLLKSACPAFIGYKSGYFGGGAGRGGMGGALMGSEEPGAPLRQERIRGHFDEVAGIDEAETNWSRSWSS